MKPLNLLILSTLKEREGNTTTGIFVLSASPSSIYFLRARRALTAARASKRPLP